MLKVCRSVALGTRLKCGFSRWYSSFPLDTANVMGMVNAKEPIMSFSDKWDILSFDYIYSSMDILSRELLFTVANDMKLGVPAAILLISTTTRLLFLHVNVKNQINMRSPYFIKISKAYKQRSRIAQQSGNKEMVAQAKYAFDIAKRKKGITLTLPMWNIFQIPILITWFFSLKYMSAIPEVYTVLPEGGWLWFKDLTTYDPYFILPLASAFLSSYSLVINPSMANNSQNPFAELSPYLKYLPFVSLSFTAFFPSTLLLYWLNIAFVQVLSIKLATSPTVQKFYSNPEQFFRRTTKHQKKFLAAQFKREFSEGLCINPNHPIFRPPKKVRDVNPLIVEVALVRQSKQRLRKRKELVASLKTKLNLKLRFKRGFWIQSIERAIENSKADAKNRKKMILKYKRVIKRRQKKLEKDAKQKLVGYNTIKPAPERPFRAKRVPVVIPEIASFKTAFPKPLNPKPQTAPA